SAEDIFSLLKKHQVTMEGKSFAVGLRVEHSQALIDRIQYRQFAGHPKLGAANYKLTYHDHDANIGIYSFCMCPGGYVLSCGTEPGRVVSNGMSNYHRNSPYANAAIVATVDHEKLFGQNNPFAGLEFRRSLESSAYEAVQKNGGTKELPAQRLMDFFHEELSSLPKSSCPSGVTPVRLDQLFPENLLPYYRQGIDNFEKSMKGFKSNEALLIGVETRTSCPVRVARDPVSMESLSHAGLFPTGEGAGYAGGITSAACDGVQVTEVLIQNHILN
ncbi:MAG: hypothetical protein KDD61_10240, partial [Bdellovibrionales bacterium]|nr:hypothetical protein [Bdellovibrionales bacterium]